MGTYKFIFNCALRFANGVHVPLASSPRERIQDPRFNASLPCDSTGKERVFKIWKLFGIYPQREDTDDYYHLHPEFVEEVNAKDKKEDKEDEDSDSASTTTDSHNKQARSHEVMICDRCRSHIKSDRVPPYSLANGVDFGDADRIGLEPLSVFESHILSPVRTYIKVVKIETNTGRRREHTQSTLKGSCIYFPHDSPRVLSELFSEENMKSDICIQFAGSRGEYDQAGGIVLRLAFAFYVANGCSSLIFHSSTSSCWA